MSVNWEEIRRQHPEENDDQIYDRWQYRHNALLKKAVADRLHNSPVESWVKRNRFKLACVVIVILLGVIAAKAQVTAVNVVRQNGALVDATGLPVKCLSGCGGAASFADNSAFTFGTTSIGNIGAVVDDLATNAVAENSAGLVRMNANRILYIDLSKTLANSNKLLVTPDSVALPANQSVNVNQLAGTATSVNSGGKDAGTLRVVLATDQPALTNKLLVTPDSVALPANQSVNISQINGVALGSPSNYGTSPGAVSVPGVNAFITNIPAVTINNALTPGATSSSGLATPFSNGALTTAVVVKASTGNIYGFVGTNGSTTTICYLEFINASSAPVLGTNAIFSVPLGVSTATVPSIAIMSPGTFGANFSTGISVGLATTYNGATACATAGSVTVLYK